MEWNLKGEFTTDFYAGKPFLPGDKVVKNWLESQIDKLLHPKYKELKSAVGNEDALEKILSVYNVDKKGYPIIGNWMLFQCSMAAVKLAGTWGKYKVSRDKWKPSIQFSPLHINLNNGKLTKKPDGVEVYTVTTKSATGKMVSFFKAYQTIKTGNTFECKLTVPDDLCEKVSGTAKDKIFEPDLDMTKKCVEDVLSYMQIVGLGAFRERFGKFEWVG